MTASPVFNADGKRIGKIEKKRQLDPMIGGPRSYNIMYHATRGPFDTGLGFSTQHEAESWLRAAAEAGGSR